MTTRPTRRQLRRHARRLSRDGYQPMFVVNSGNDIPESAAMAIARAIWRYRSELAPIAVATATVGAATMLHRAHHRRVALASDSHAGIPHGSRHPATRMGAKGVGRTRPSRRARLRASPSP